MITFLVFGGNGWIGSKFIKYVEDLHLDIKICLARVRADNISGVMEDVSEFKPDRILCFIGRTSGEGYATIDYLEQKGKLVENIRDNLYAPISLGMICKERNIHMTYVGTGCIYNYNNDYPMNSGKGFVESDDPNFFGSSYSTVKGFTNSFMEHFLHNSVLHLRIRMPISSDESPRNFIKKITHYQKICSIPNSVSVLEDLIPIAFDMILKELVGTINFVQPGTISHNEILEMYREIVDAEFKWENFSLEEQRLVLLADRSNNCLDTTRLQTLYPYVTPVKQAVRKILEDIKKKRVEIKVPICKGENHKVKSNDGLRHNGRVCVKDSDSENETSADNHYTDQSYNSKYENSELGDDSPEYEICVEGRNLPTDNFASGDELITPEDNIQSEIDFLDNVPGSLRTVETEAVKKKDLCVLLHISCFSLWDEMESYFKNICMDYDLYITIPFIDKSHPSVIEYIRIMRVNRPGFELENSLEKVEELRSRVLRFKSDAIVMVVPNKGLDPGGWLRSMHEIKTMKREYTYMIKLHSKLRDYRWRHALWNALLCSRQQFEKCVKIFETETKVGMIGSKQWLVDCISPETMRWINYYREKWNITIENSWFIGGTMFMVRFSIMKKAFENVNCMECADEMEEGYAPDGLKAHALERVFALVVWNQGFTVEGVC